MSGKGSTRRFDIISERDGVMLLTEVKNGPRAGYRWRLRRNDNRIADVGAVAFGPRAEDAGIKGWYDPAMFVIQVWYVR